MFLRTSLLTLALLGGAGSAAASPPSEPCFAGHSVTKVVRYEAEFPAGQGTYDRLVGARAYVPATPGLTGEWLHAQLARRSAERLPGTTCPLDVPGVNISVDSTGPGFWVSLAARDHDAAKEVLRRARTLTL